MAQLRKSFGMQIRDGVFDKVKQLDFFGSTVHFQRNKMRPTQTENIPALGCYLIDEVLSPDGVANSGVPHFTHNLRLGFSYWILNNDPDKVDDVLDEAYWALTDGFMEQPLWQHIDEGVDIEAITRITRRHNYGNQSLNNDNPIAELQCEMTCQFHSYIVPIIPDELERVNIKIVHPWPDDGSKQTVTAEWLLENE